MSNKSCQENPPKIPFAHNGIQFNCCKFTRCENFGLTPEEIEEKTLSNKYIEKDGKRQPIKLSTFYTLQGAGPKSTVIICKGCIEFARTSPYKNQTYYSLKSNKGICEEYERISGYLTEAGSKCANTDCESNLGTKSVSIKKRGKTPKGTQRYYCNVCKTSFTGKPRDRVHDNTEIDIYFFRTLLSRTPLARIAKLFGISMPTLYRRIDFIHRKCVEFVANRERRLATKKYERMYLCTDRQIYISNWTNRKEKKNCEFYVIGTADLTSSYILAYNFNYDPSLNPDEVEQHAEELGEHEKKKHHRHYARAWLKRDFEAIKATKGKKRAAKGTSLKEDLEQQIAFNELYDPDSASEAYGKSNQLPIKGMEIHNDYTMAAHFHLIKTLTGGVEKTRFFMDLDEGMSSSYKAAFKEQIKAGNSDGFSVSMTKHLTIDEKRKIARDRKLEVSAFCGKKYNSLSNQELNIAIRDMIKVSMENPTRPSNAYEAWVRNPMPSLNEVDKHIAAVTNIQRYDLDHQANLYRKASLHAIDRFFNQIRASLSPFARPTRTGSGSKGTWYGYQPYNPELYTKLGEIFRVYFNYCQVDKKHNATPAMKLGLAKGPVDVEKIIYYNKYQSN